MGVRFAPDFAQEQLKLKIDHYKHKIQKELELKDNKTFSKEDYELYLQIAQQLETKQLHPFQELFNKIESITVLDT